jgi:hypothetical protein
MSHQLVHLLAGFLATVSIGLTGVPAVPSLLQPLPAEQCAPGGGGGGGGGGGVNLDDFMMWDGTGGGYADLPIWTVQPCGVSRIIKFDTWDISARAGEDYVGVVQGTVILPANTTSTYVRIQILGDNKYEGTETFGVRLTSGATFDDFEGIVTLKDR